MKLLIGVDGAFYSDADDAEYRAAYRDSFVQRIYGRAMCTSEYFRGPDTFMLTDQIFPLADRIAARMRMRTRPGDEIALVGWSRGATACLLAATTFEERSGRDGRSITDICLFDAVANDGIAQTVCRHLRLRNTRVFHARRNLHADLPEHAIQFPRLEIRTDHLMQNDFAGDHGDLGMNSDPAYRWIASKLAAAGFIR